MRTRDSDKQLDTWVSMYIFSTILDAFEVDEYKQPQCKRKKARYHMAILAMWEN